MANERAEFVATLDLQQVNASLAKAREKQDELLGSGSRLDKGLGGIHEGMEKLHASTRRLSQGIGAMSLVMGESTSESSKLFKETVHLGSAFILGGPLMGGTVLAIAAFQKLSEIYEENEERSRTFSEATKGLGEAIEAGGKKKLTEMREELAKLTKDLRDFAGNTRQMALNEAEFNEHMEQVRFVNLQKNIARQKDELENLKLAQIQAARAGADRETLLNIGKQWLEQKAIVALSERRLGVVKEELTTSFQIVATTQELVNKEADLAKAKKDGAGAYAAELKRLRNEDNRADDYSPAKGENLLAEALKPLDDEYAYARELEESGRKAAADARHHEIAELAKDSAKRVEIAKAAAAKEVAEAKAAAAKVIAANEAVGKSYENLYGNVLGGTLDTGLSSFTGYLDAKAKGEKEAEKKAVAGFLKSEGTQLVAIGTKAVIEGAIISANPLTPGAGAGMIAIGAVAIGAGVGMGAAGAAVDAQGTSGGGSSSGAATDRGVNTGNASTKRGGGGATTSGSTIINVVYSAAGPAPQDTGRTVSDAIKAFYRSSGQGSLGPQGPSR